MKKYKDDIFFILYILWTKCTIFYIYFLCDKKSRNHDWHGSHILMRRKKLRFDPKYTSRSNEFVFRNKTGRNKGQRYTKPSSALEYDTDQFYVLKHQFCK